MKYKHLFFDLDHTLWDFEKNARETLTDLYAKHDLNRKGISSSDLFISKYFEINTRMWDLYHNNLMDRETLRTIRFEKTFDHFDVQDQTLKNIFPGEYLDILPTKKNLFPDAAEVLAFLHGKYKLHLITNGFEKVQAAKIHASGLEKYFEHVIISEQTGYKKPDKEIFHYAMKAANAEINECIMIGDDLEADIKGADAAGWDTVFFNPLKIQHPLIVTFEISELSALKKIL